MTSSSPSASSVRIVATGLYTPPESITNAELVESYNAFVDKWNAENPDREPKEHSSVGFIEKASGIKARYVVNKSGALDPDRMRPELPPRGDDELSIMAEMAVAAAKDAMTSGGFIAADIDGVICAASNMQRGYPAIAVEIQDALDIDGYGYDMNVACASAAFGIQNAVGLIMAGAKRILMVNPEICTGHINFRDRDCHFIFGDVATAVIIEKAAGTPKGEAWEIIDTRLKTKFSNNIRNNFGFMNHASDELDISDAYTDKLFKQNGRAVFKEVVPMVATMITEHLKDNDLTADELQRMWLHQANLNMNLLIGKKVLGRDMKLEEAPIVLDEYANTSSAGSIIAFHKHRQDMSTGDIGVICAFGAGYSAGSVIVKKVA